MYKLFDCTLTDETLERFVEQFVPQNGLYFFEDEHILRTLSKSGIAVYTQEEIRRSFPSLWLEYGRVYHVWDLSLPAKPFVTLLDERQLLQLQPEDRDRLFKQQIQYGRGHIYSSDWFPEVGDLKTNTVTIDGTEHYLLTYEDWQNFSVDVRKAWILRWLHEWMKDDAQGLDGVNGTHVRVPYTLIPSYPSTPDHSQIAVARIVLLRRSRW